MKQSISWPDGAMLSFSLFIAKSLFLIRRKTKEKKNHKEKIGRKRKLSVCLYFSPLCIEFFVHNLFAVGISIFPCDMMQKGGSMTALDRRRQQMIVSFWSYY